jgi:hypothetical protein
MQEGSLKSLAQRASCRSHDLCSFLLMFAFSTDFSSQAIETIRNMLLDFE